jgi:synaptobrevin family protein YKT6
MSNKPVAAYIFVSEGYPERVAFAFLNKILEIFNEKVGDKWKKMKDDENLNI